MVVLGLIPQNHHLFFPNRLVNDCDFNIGHEPDAAAFR